VLGVYLYTVGLMLETKMRNTLNLEPLIKIPLFAVFSPARFDVL
jgi:hypothetical protein